MLWKNYLQKQMKLRPSTLGGALVCLVFTWFAVVATVGLHSRFPNSTSLAAANMNFQQQVKVFEVLKIPLLAHAPDTKSFLNGPGVKATFSGPSCAVHPQECVAKGFWNGENKWEIRFSPTQPGNYTYVTSSTDPDLNGRTGQFLAVPQTAGELAANPILHGFLQRNGDAWMLSDSTPFIPAGDSQFSFPEELTEAEAKAWIDALHQVGMNSLLGTVWLGKYRRGGIAPFRDWKPKTEELNPAYFQRLDQVIEHANSKGIIVGLMIGGFPDNSDWYDSDRFGNKDRNDRWFKYCVARYAAYNIRWILYGEVNEKDPPDSWYGKDKTWERVVDDYAKLVEEEDPYGHPLGSHHNSVDKHSAGNRRVDYVVVQQGTMGHSSDCNNPMTRSEKQYEDALSYRKDYHKPVWYEEYWYEPAIYDNDYRRGIRNTHRNFIAALAYPTMGSLMRGHACWSNFPPNKVSADKLKEYLIGNDKGLARMKYFVDFYRGLDTINFHAVDRNHPASVNRGHAGQFGDSYAIFLQGGRDVTVKLPGSGTFSITMLNINTGVQKNLPNITAGKSQTISTKTEEDVTLLLRPI